MKKGTKTLFSFALLITFFLSCKKNWKEEVKNATSVIDLKTKGSVANKDITSNLNKLTSKAYTYNKDENIIITQLNELFETPVITSKKSIKFFQVISNKKTKTNRQEQVIEIVADFDNKSTLNQELVVDLIIKKNNNFSGTMIFLGKDNKYLNEEVYKNGILKNTKTIISKFDNTSNTNRTCQAWYLNVYIDGVLSSSTYLYTTCTGDGAAGGGGGCEQTRMLDNNTSPFTLKCGGGGGGSGTECKDEVNDFLTTYTQPQFNSTYTGSNVYTNGNIYTKKIEWPFLGYINGLGMTSGWKCNLRVQVENIGIVLPNYKFIVGSAIHDSYTQFGYSFFVTSTCSEKHPVSFNYPNPNVLRTSISVTVKNEYVCKGSPFSSNTECDRTFDMQAFLVGTFL